MKKVFIDLEMNRIPRGHHIDQRVLGMEIIQIGAVMLDENNREINSFCEYVRPEFATEVAPNIEKLTGISFAHLAGASSLRNVLDRFVSWCGNDYEIYSWSETDLIQIQKETGFKQIAVTGAMKYMEEHWRDYQAEFGSLLTLERQLSLKDAILMAGLEFIGREHDGLNDARSTAAIYQMVADPQRFKRFRKDVMSAFGIEEPRMTLADMFDFSGLQLAVG